MTVKERAVTQLDLKLKYIATLETLTEAFGSELFEPVSLRTSDGKGNAEGQPLKQPIRYQVLVSGTVGIQWRLKPAEVRGGRWKCLYVTDSGACPTWAGTAHSCYPATTEHVSWHVNKI